MLVVVVLRIRARVCGGVPCAVMGLRLTLLPLLVLFTSVLGVFRRAQDTINAVALLIGNAMPRLAEIVDDSLSTLPGPTDRSRTDLVEMLSSLVSQRDGEQPPAFESVMNRRRGDGGSDASDDVTGGVGGDGDDIPLEPAVEACVRHCGPLLMLLSCATKNFTVRSSALLALSRMAYSPPAARSVTPWTVLLLSCRLKRSRCLARRACCCHVCRVNGAGVSTSRGTVSRGLLSVQAAALTRCSAVRVRVLPHGGSQRVLRGAAAHRRRVQCVADAAECEGSTCDATRGASPEVGPCCHLRVTCFQSTPPPSPHPTPPHPTHTHPHAPFCPSQSVM